MQFDSSSSVNLPSLFRKVNDTHFDGFLDPPKISWNSRLRSSAGRFIPGSRKFWKQDPPQIEIASYLLQEVNAEALILDTLSHEMIHYWLWVMHRPYGHSADFYAKMKLMGVSRYNSVPRNRPYKYVYQCNFCQKTFPSRKKLSTLACLKCCKEFSEGRYDPRFKLVLSPGLGAGELIKLS